MTRPARVRARFSPCDGETYEAEIVMPAPYACAIEEAERSVTRMVKNMIDHAATVFRDDAKTDPETKK